MSKITTPAVNYSLTPGRKSRRDRNLAAALAAAEAGFRVFPVSVTPRAKDPSKKTAKPLVEWGSEASTDTAQVKRWWLQYPEAVPGMATGEVFVVDLDKKPDADGEAGYRALGLDPDDANFVVRTPSGGRHLYFREAPGLSISQGKAGPGIDTRGHTGFVFVPGAQTFMGTYEIERGDWMDLEFRSLPDAPGPIVAALTKPAREPVEQSEPGGYTLETIRDALFSIPASVGYDDWFLVLAALHHETGGSAQGLAFAQAWSSPFEHWTAKEVVAKWRSFGKTDGPQAGAGTLFRIAREHGWQEITADSFEDLPEEPETAESHLTFLSPAECAATDPRPYVVKGLIGERDVGCIVGAPGVGKSLLAPAIAYGVAQGTSLFGRRVRQGGVLYVAAEDSHGMRGRVTALRNELGDASGFALVEGVSDLLTGGSRDYRALRLAVKEQRPSLIVLDTLAMAFPGLEENSAEGMGRVVAVARSLTKWGAAVVLIHHDTKDGQQGLPRGHSLLNGALDFSIHLKADGGVVTGRLTKNRNGSCDQSLAFSIRAAEIGVDQDGDTVTAAIADLLDEAPERAPRLSPSNRATLDLLVEMGSRAPRPDFVKAASENVKISSADTSESRARAVRRAISHLSRIGRVRVTDDMVEIVAQGAVFEDFQDDR